MIVTIDGPAGTGKSTVAKTVARELGFEYLDTGAMYRVVALLVLAENESPESALIAGRIAEGAAIEFREGRCFARGHDVTDDIRTATVTEASSMVARHVAVRSALVKEQQRIASDCDIVCEGRDQGTVVFPHALCKFFLVATPEIRTQRRLNELRCQGSTIDFDSLLQQILDRDQRDADRDIAPLRPADDARLIDTSQLTTDEVVAVVLQEVRRQMALNS